MIEQVCNLKVPKAEPKLPENVFDLFNLKGKVASVTGASGGIGYEVALGFAEAGADVAMWYHSHPKIESEVEELSKKYGVKIKAYKCGVTNSVEVESTVDQIVRDFGKIDIQVANAGVDWHMGPIVDCVEKAGREAADRDWQRVMDVDLNSVYYLARSTGKYFKKQGHGSLILTASMSGHIVNIPQMHAVYNSAKAGVIHLGKSLAIEWAGYARVNSISPGYIESAMTEIISEETRDSWLRLIPMGRLANPRELVGAYLFLASDASTYVTGTDIRVDGGYCIV